MKQVLLSLCMLLLSVTGNTASAASKFTGIMAMIMKMPNGSAEITYYFGNDVQRMDMAMQMDKIPEPLKTTVITKASQPDQAYVINHQAKNYTILNLTTAAEQAMLLNFDSNYKLTKIGKQTIKGYNCEHISLTSSTEKPEHPDHHSLHCRQEHHVGNVRQRPETRHQDADEGGKKCKLWGSQ